MLEQPDVPLWQDKYGDNDNNTLGHVVQQVVWVDKAVALCSDLLTASVLTGNWTFLPVIPAGI